MNSFLSVDLLRSLGVQYVGNLVLRGRNKACRILAATKKGRKLNVVLVSKSFHEHLLHSPHFSLD